MPTQSAPVLTDLTLPNQIIQTPNTAMFNALWEGAGTSTIAVDVAVNSGSIVHYAWYRDNSKTWKKPEPKIIPAQMKMPRKVFKFAQAPQFVATHISNGEDFIVEPMQEPITHTLRSNKKDAKGNYIFDMVRIENAPTLSNGEILDPEFEDLLGKNSLRRLQDNFYFKDPTAKFDWQRKRIIELRQPPAFIQRKSHEKAFSEQEQKARTLLKRYVGEKEYRRYLKFGYIILQAHGFDWRVPGERSSVARVEQYLKGKLVAKYCVHFEDCKIPPTDACIMRMALIQGGVDMIANASNVYNPQQDHGLNFLGQMIDSVVEERAKQKGAIQTFKDAFDFLKRKIDNLPTVNLPLIGV